MTAKEKALEIIDKMYNTENCGIKHYPNKHYCDCSEINEYQSKQCALVAVDEILLQLNSRYYGMTDTHRNDIIFWEEVKQEIIKL